jgi:hypothetical protein
MRTGPGEFGLRVKYNLGEFGVDVVPGAGGAGSFEHRFRDRVGSIEGSAEGGKRFVVAQGVHRSADDVSDGLVVERRDRAEQAEEFLVFVAEP